MTSRGDISRTDERKRILVVDDSAPERMLLGFMLDTLGYAVIEAENGEDAYDKICRVDIHMVLSDWMMPCLDGPSLCRRIRNSYLGHYVYFVLLSSKDSCDDRRTGTEAGADSFISKPVSMSELRARLYAGERVLDFEASASR
jgi:sigma-B regulation protein RsbU (phosphoserine phosphatase)